MVCQCYARRERILITSTESVIDTIPHPELRDRMILLRGKSVATSQRFILMVFFE